MFDYYQRSIRSRFVVNLGEVANSFGFALEYAESCNRKQMFLQLGSLRREYSSASVILELRSSGHALGEAVRNSYTSHNKKLLDVDGVVHKILTTDYVQEELKVIKHL